MSRRDPFLADLWQFVRGDGALAEFEQWIYAHRDELESRLGKQQELEYSRRIFDRAKLFRRQAASTRIRRA
jgi:hypothetical protein